MVIVNRVNNWQLVIINQRNEQFAIIAQIGLIRSVKSPIISRIGGPNRHQEKRAIRKFLSWWKVLYASTYKSV